MGEYGSQVAAVDPLPACGALLEMIGFACWRKVVGTADVLATHNATQHPNNIRRSAGLREGREGAAPLPPGRETTEAPPDAHPMVTRVSRVARRTVRRAAWWLPAQRLVGGAACRTFTCVKRLASVCGAGWPSRNGYKPRQYHDEAAYHCGFDDFRHANLRAFDHEGMVAPAVAMECEAQHKAGE